MAGIGHMCATSVGIAARHHEPCCSAMHPTARSSIRPRTSPGSRAISMRRAMPASIRFMMNVSQRSPAGRTSGASSLMSTPQPGRRPRDEQRCERQARARPLLAAFQPMARRNLPQAGAAFRPRDRDPLCAYPPVSTVPLRRGWSARDLQQRGGAPCYTASPSVERTGCSRAQIRAAIAPPPSTA